jgi:hypothetical protein
MHDVVTDVMTSVLQDVDVRAWTDAIRDTETHSSALRITESEREQIDDLLRDLRRKERCQHRW